MIMSFLLHKNFDHQGERATVVDLNIAIEGNIYVNQLYDKRQMFHFLVLPMPYLSSKVSSSIFCGGIF